MSKYRSYVLPVAIVLGLIFYEVCSKLSFIVPFLIFSILILNFVTVDLRHLRFSKLHLWLILFQLFVSIGLFFSVFSLSGNSIIAQGLMMGVLCPVASSVVVVSSMLGGDKMTTTAYTILCNLVISVFAPLYFSLAGIMTDLSFVSSFWLIFKKIAPTIAFPFFIVLFIQIFAPKINETLCKYQSLSFYLWAVALFITLGKTISFIFSHGNGNGHVIAIFAFLSVAVCAAQFAFGKWLGKRYGDSIAGGQLLGQKNTAMGIWMANTYLEPLSSVFLAFYIIWQNLFNSFQIWYFDNRKRG